VAEQNGTQARFFFCRRLIAVSQLSALFLATSGFTSSLSQLSMYFSLPHLILSIFYPSGLKFYMIIP
jgi:hypothetical protein